VVVKSAWDTRTCFDVVSGSAAMSFLRGHAARTPRQVQ
jgi:hypothetical protein